MQIHFTPDPDMEAWLADAAAREGVDMAAIVRNALVERMRQDAHFAGLLQQGLDDFSQGRFVEQDAAKVYISELRKNQPNSL